MKFTGTHIQGRGRARTLGFPTINLHNINTLTMEDGVYAAKVTIDNTTYNAALFIGESPTFKDKEKSVELHLIGVTDADIKTHNLSFPITSKISVETVQFMRPVVKYKSKEELIHHISENIQEIQTILSSKE